MKNVLLVLILLLAGCASADVGARCHSAPGRWLAEYGECEMVSRAWCEKQKGLYRECTSACRHQPDAVMCTKQCVPVCHLKK